MSDNRAQGPVLNDDVPEDGAGDQTAAASSGTEKVLGQAGEAVVVERPAPGQSIEIQATAGQTYVLNFPPQISRGRETAPGAGRGRGLPDPKRGWARPARRSLSSGRNRASRSKSRPPPGRPTS